MDDRSNLNIEEIFAKSPTQDLGIAAGAGITTGGALLLDKQVKDMLIKTHKWADKIQDLHSQPFTGDIAKAVKVGEIYGQGARELIRTKLLGIPLPYLGLSNRKAHITIGDKTVGKLFRLANSPEETASKRLALAIFKIPKLGGKLKDIGEKLQYARLDDQGLREHYRNFYDPKKLSNAQLNIYSALHSIPGKIPNVSAETNRLLSSVDGKHFSLTNALLEIRKKNPEDIAILKGMFKTRYTDLAGVGKLGGGLGHTYQQAMTDVSRILRRGAKSTAALASAVAIYMGSKGITKLLNNRSLNKEAADEDSLRKSFLGEDTKKLGLLSLLSGFTGAVSLGKGVSELNRPVNVGFTFGDNTKSFGSGHREPGKALRGIVEEIVNERKLKNVNITEPVSSRFGTLDPKLQNLKYDLHVDTGIGWNNPMVREGNHSAASKVLRSLGLRDIAMPGDITSRMDPKIALGGYVGYVTDLGGAGTPYHGYEANVKSKMRSLLGRLTGIKDNYIVWGPPDKQMSFPKEPGFANSKDFTIIRPSEAAGKGFPTMGKSAISILSDLGKTDLTRLTQEAIEDKILDKNSIPLLNTVTDGKRKLIMITGSGRGDQVAVRMLQVQKVLKRLKLDDKYVIGGMLGEGYDYNPISRAVGNDPNFLTFKGKVPQKYYVGFPGLASATWGSTGTSALEESLASPTRLSYSESQNRIGKVEHRLLGRHGKRLQELYGGDAEKARNSTTWRDWKWHQDRGLNTDEWNRYNKEWSAEGQPGVTKVKNARDFVKKILADTAEDSVIQRRARDHLNMDIQARMDIKSQLADVLKRQMLLKKITGVGKGTAGIALMALPAYFAHKRFNKAPLVANSRFNVDKELSKIRRLYNI
jgi:hypothetical protein